MSNSTPPESWRALLRNALTALDTLPDGAHWTWGGGTALALHLNHRRSYDIDIFLTDGTLFNQLRPTVNPAVRRITDNWQIPGHYIKLECDGGEIDFIAAALLTEPGWEEYRTEGRVLRLETAEEVLAKKLNYRGSNALARDIFDFAAAKLFAPDALTQAIAASPDGAERVADTITRRRDRILREFDAGAIDPMEKGEAVFSLDLLDLAADLRQLAQGGR